MLVSVESGLTGLESVPVPNSFFFFLGQESCCSRVCSGQSGHSVELEQLSHCSPWPQGSDTEPCSPHVTQHCLCFLYTTFMNTRHRGFNLLNWTIVDDFKRNISNISPVYKNVLSRI